MTDETLSSPESVAILGSGSWGTALALVAAETSPQVILWGRDPVAIDEIKTTRRNQRYLPDVELPDNVIPTTDLAAAANSGIILSVVPSRATRGMMRALKATGALSPDSVIVSCSKGIELDSGKTMCEIISEELPNQPNGVLSGPSHAEEVGRKLATAMVVAATEPALAERLQTAFLAPWVRPYTSTDVVGLEWGGAVKNVFAIAAGIVDGLGLGDNAKAALVTRGLAEMTRLGVALGGQRETFQGLSGVGDLIATCYSIHSRNFRVGRELGSGRELEEIMGDMTMVAEGVPNTESIYKWARKAGARTPVIDEVYGILYQGTPPLDALRSLLSRDPRPEADDRIQD